MTLEVSLVIITDEHLVILYDILTASVINHVQMQKETIVSYLLHVYNPQLHG